MSTSPAMPIKYNLKKRNMATLTSLKSFVEDNNNTSKSISRLQARTFVSWYKRMIDYERQNFALYLSDEVVLEWFGKTIRKRKKVASFLKYDMQSSKHDLTTVESIERISVREDHNPRKLEFDVDEKLASPLHSPEIIKTRYYDRIPPIKNRKRPGLRSSGNSPEWDKDCKPVDADIGATNRKKAKRNYDSINHKLEIDERASDKSSTILDTSELTSKGDGALVRKAQRVCMLITPPNCEQGQGDCLPSTSSDSEMSHAALNAQLPKKAVECNGYISFTRTRNSRSTDAMKWERKCKVQISYSEDPLNVGEYIIWAIHYTDESKCRRNLLAAFEEVANEDMKKI